jgi:hypothetical protein
MAGFDAVDGPSTGTRVPWMWGLLGGCGSKRFSMKIRAGYEISYDCPQPTPMILTLSVHPHAVPIY